MLTAPFAYSVDIIACKKLRNKIMIAVSCRRRAVTLPYKQRENVENIAVVKAFVFFGHFRSPCKDYVRFVKRGVKHFLKSYLCLVAEYRRYIFAEILSDSLVIALMCYLYKFVRCVGVKHINVRIAVKPRRGKRRFRIRIPLCTLCGIVFAYFVKRFQKSVFVKYNIVASRKRTVSSTLICYAEFRLGIDLSVFRIRNGREQKLT